MLIAVVDPSMSFRAVLRSVQAESPVDWAEFASLAEARAGLLDGGPDMVITAKELGDGGYLDLLRDIRKQQGREYLPVYLFSSDDSEQLVSEAFAQGITDVFEKQHISEIVELLQKLAFFSSIARGARVPLVEDDPALSLYYARQLQQARHAGRIDPHSGADRRQPGTA